MTRYVDRSRIVTDWQCQRKRYWAYEYAGRGISPATTSLELWIGTSVHDALAAIARGELSIDIIATESHDQLYESLSQTQPGEVPDSDTLIFAAEQAALVEGLIRGFHKHVWPRILPAGWRVIAVEQECVYSITPELKFMSRPDLIIADPEDNWWYCEWKTTSTKKQAWIDSWATAVQLHSGCKAVEETLGHPVMGVIVQGLYKGYECLVPETPVLTADLTWKPVGDLVVGEKLAGFEEESGNNRSGGKALREWREAEVTHTGRQNLPCYELLLEDGTSFICSSNHLWLTAQKAQGMGSAVWKTTEEVVAGGTRIVKLIEPWKGTGEFDPYDAGYLAAAFDGEGSLSSVKFDRNGDEYHSLHLQYTQNPNAMQQFMFELCSIYGLKYSLNERGNDHKAQDIQFYGKIKLLSLLGKIRPKRLLPKLDFNKLGMIKDLPTQPVRVLQKTFVGEREVVTLGTSTKTFVANGFASHNSYGKQSSPFCYGYARSGQAPFVSDQIRYDYAPGFRRSATWLGEGGVRQWVDEMPEDILADQFPQAPPIFVREELVARFFEQVKVRENEIDIARSLWDSQLHDPMSNDEILDTYFAQHFDQCQPTFGRGCTYRRLCHSRVDQPLEQGYVPRLAHHSPEEEQHALLDAPTA